MRLHDSYYMTRKSCMTPAIDVQPTLLGRFVEMFYYLMGWEI